MSNRNIKEQVQGKFFMNYFMAWNRTQVMLFSMTAEPAVADSILACFRVIVQCAILYTVQDTRVSVTSTIRQNKSILPSTYKLLKNMQYCTG